MLESSLNAEGRLSLPGKKREEESETLKTKAAYDPDLQKSSRWFVLTLAVPPKNSSGPLENHLPESHLLNRDGGALLVTRSIRQDRRHGSANISM